MLFPEYLEPFRKEAEKIFSEKKVLEIIFSGPTYQILVEKDIWVFVQLDQDSQVKDIFCQCNRCQDEGSCVHMALALVALSGQESIPLHIRFEKSPFYIGFSPLAHKGFSHELKRKNEKLSIGDAVTIFGPESWLKTLLKEITPKDENEETSIKFSDLSEEEIENWRKGVFSQRLRFELSPFADLAKKLFLLSNKEQPSFSIQMQQKKPTLSIKWNDISAVLTLSSKEHLGALLDSLPPEQTTPNLFPYGGMEIQDFVYDTNTQECIVHLSGEKLPVGTTIDKTPWSYSEKKGFIKKAPSNGILRIKSDKITDFLFHYAKVSPQDIQYSIQVDAEKGLFVTPFFKKPHDLDQAVFFGPWLWTKELGFQRIKSLRWRKRKISLEEAEDFIFHNRHLLSLIPGFFVHEHSAKQTVCFQVDSTGSLSFTTQPVHTSREKSISLGKWTYVKNLGFFLKERALPLPSGPIPPHHVAAFIRKHGEILKDVSGFFSDKVPIHGVELIISFTKKKNIELSPRYKWEKPEYEKTFFFYEDFGYVPNVGFFLLPPLLSQTHLSKTISPSERDVWDSFFLEQLPILKKEFPCIIDPCLEPPKSLTLVCDSLSTQEIKSTTKLPHQWDALFHWESEKGKVSSHELLRAYMKKVRFCPSAAGLVDLTEEKFGWLSSAPLLKSTSAHTLATTDLLKIHAHEEFLLTENVAAQTRFLIQKLLEASPQTPPLLESLDSNLRPYQKKGVDWLWYLYTSGLSGLLCDDMGVGKTHQAMALLCSVDAFCKKENQKPLFLILCPTSLFWHWKEKIESVLPHLPVFSYVGGDRSEFVLGGKERIFLTTYGIWRNEVADLKKIPFEVAIFDELQIAKNHVSRIWAALSQVKATMRLGLSGTPIENNIDELKALFDLLLPGYLPKPALPKLTEKRTAKKYLISRYARPFILRRRKQDVLLDLPQKTEEILTTQLIGDQKALYKQIAARQSAHIVQQLQDDLSPIPYMHIFALLSALKQICNHPAAYLRDVANYHRYESGKWDAFTELLEEAQESGQKVIIFSHYLAMLDIIALHLKSKNILFSEIRGSTKHRGEAVSRFQKDPHCTVFLGSLQAAGLGIDLTAGSVVIHYDRWWNAARENQATDRAHRIGQTRGVMVYKLLTTSTVEERIDELITQKAKLFEDIIKFDDHRVMKQFNRQELISLLTNIDSV